MEKGKGISPGCLVMLTKAHFPENVGKIGTAINIYTENAPEGRLWTVKFNAAVKSQFVLYNDKHYLTQSPVDVGDVCHHPEAWLKRIDGDPDDIFGEEDTMKPTSTVGELMKENMDRYGVEA